MRQARVVLAAALALALVGEAWPQQDPATQPQAGRMMGPGWDMWNPGWMQRGWWRPGMMGPGQQQRMVRHWTFMHEGVPAAYRGAETNVPASSETLRAGALLYAQNCAACDGATGMGDGEAGRALSPSPALLAYLIQMPMAVDEYLPWSISEGGARFGTEMPGFKDKLTQKQIWQIVSYLRAGLRPAYGSGPPLPQ